jgi:N-acetylmuramoyl-L-alanine amidase
MHEIAGAGSVMVIDKQILTKNKYSRPAGLLKSVKGVVIHWVGNPGSSAQANRNYFEGLKDQIPPHDSRYASAHYIIGLTGEIIQCIPDSEIAYHVGADQYTNQALRRLSTYPNNCTIGIELCHPEADGKFTEKTLDSCRELAGELLMRFGLTPIDLWRHYDITEKICPKYFTEHEDAWRLFVTSV